MRQSIHIGRHTGGRLVPDIGSAVARQAGARERGRSLHGAQAEQEFTIEVYGGTGRVPTRLCSFGYAFTLKPTLVASVALQDGDVVINTVPEAKIIGSNWIRNDAGLYLGCRVTAWVTGHRRQRLNLSYIFSGIGLNYPLGPSASDLSWDDPI